MPDKSESSKYKGMTVNERLYLGGYMDEFDKAITEENSRKVIDVLLKVELNMDSIIPILKQYGLEIPNDYEE